MYETIDIENVLLEEDGRAFIAVSDLRCEIEAIIIQSRKTNTPTMKIKVVSPHGEVLIEKEQSGIGEKAIFYPRKDVSREKYDDALILSDSSPSKEMYLIIGDLAVVIENGSSSDIIDKITLRIVK